MYHGHGKQAPFFEGWYYKLVSADETHRYAIIPGVFLGPEGYAFVQVLNGGTGETTFHTYHLTDFWASKNDFQVRIGPNAFTLDHIQLAIEDNDAQVRGELRFSGVHGWPVSLASPGIMGWYAWVPFMECYHGVLGFDHDIQGLLEVNGSRLDFSYGRGYIEKDWGQAFPSAYIWTQSNHFSQFGASLCASVAMIPWIGHAFRGFIVGLWHQGELYRFATYTGARIDNLEISENSILWSLSDRRCRLEVTAHRAASGIIKGPTRHEMDMRVAESLKAGIHVRLSTKDGEVIIDDTGHHGGLEVQGNLDHLIEAWK